MLLHPSNFLLLDEPTNHLDLRAKDMLLFALQAFTGTVVFVSHDRYFIDRLATRVFEVAAGAVHVFPGNYEDYLWKKQNAEGGAAPAVVHAAVSIPSNGDSASDPPPTAEPKPRRLNPIKLRQMQERCTQIEEEIARLEAGIAECESALTSFVSAAETARLSELLQRRRTDLETLLAEWEEISRAIQPNA